MSRELSAILRRKVAINPQVGMVSGQLEDLQEAWYLERQIQLSQLIDICL